MAQNTRKPPRIEDLVTAADNAARGGNLTLAHAIWGDVIARDNKVAAYFMTRALVGAEIGEVDMAAADLTQVLRLTPTNKDACWRLSRLLARFRLEDARGLDRFGLRAALTHGDIAQQPIVEAIFDHLFLVTPSLNAALMAARAGIDAGDDTGLLEAARQLIGKRTNDGLKDDLLLLALGAGKVMRPEIERLLAGLRRVMVLELPAERFEDRALSTFAVALCDQNNLTNFVAGETAAEATHIDALAIDPAKLAAGDFETCRALLLKCLYRPLAEAFGCPHAELQPALVQGVRPKVLRDHLTTRLAEVQDLVRRAGSITRLKPLSNAISLKVAGQYEASPYPRWRTILTTPPGMLRQALTAYFTEPELTFMDQPYDVLCAGCGTGQHALQSASAMGRNARILAIDISAASLAYAERKAAELGITNVEFMQADILDAGLIDRRFDVIESVGVLHHMDDPMAGWRALLAKLKPKGKMYIGLYSRTSRREITALKADPAWPGAGASDAAARVYRQTILQRFYTGATEAPGTILVNSRDFFALNEFRDLALHQNERTHTIEEIAAFLASEKLDFHGFTMEPQMLAEFRDFCGDAAATGPGKLADWSRYETANPRTFDAMYRFWCAARS